MWTENASLSMYGITSLTNSCVSVITKYIPKAHLIKRCGNYIVTI